MWYETFQPEWCRVSCDNAPRLTAIPTGVAAYESYIVKGRAA